MKYLTIAATALALSASAASAATIIDTTTNTAQGFRTLGNFSVDQDPLGQTFTLTQATNNIVAGGVVRDVNDFLNPTFDIIISIYSGAGFGGSLLGSVTSTLADGFEALHTVSFASLGTLGAGEYTLGFSSGGTGRGSLQTVVDSAGTVSYNELGIFADNIANGDDFSILVTGDAASVSAVPLPAGFPLLAAGLIGMGALARRKKAA
ncbi:VPLPA-CTERM sorting domain-containing protein [Pseudooceanicola nitratireducens]|uniref:VPLPA-CTERM sorting domain-containing protein n=1 Tax=Pseudooceanicola nitratireducens TaxID=517719 RepID=UPI001C96791E|nr:VPLPA-CTERM sorting domain-containing protein [Pseudooceanicola nitratireducens]MBY6155807.1 VPLPA-CTERM sorting domain-containing protein [Pseudooceanicola nitratireducens]